MFSEALGEGGNTDRGFRMIRPKIDQRANSPDPLRLLCKAAVRRSD